MIKENIPHTEDTQSLNQTDSKTNINIFLGSWGIFCTCGVGKKLYRVGPVDNQPSPD